MPNTDATTHAAWPALRYEEWKDTYATLHMWTQVVGKIVLALTPLTNHFWIIAFKVTSRGLIVISINVKALRAFMNRRSAETA